MAEPTKAQMAWLEKLEREGRATRTRGRTGYLCGRNGWTEWAYEHEAAGTVLTETEVFAAVGDEYALWGEYRIIGDVLTPLGRQVLAEAREREARSDG